MGYEVEHKEGALDNENPDKAFIRKKPIEDHLCSRSQAIWIAIEIMVNSYESRPESGDYEACDVAAQVLQSYHRDGQAFSSRLHALVSWLIS